MGLGRAQVLDRIMRCDYRLPRYPHTSPECRDLLQRILVGNPDERLTIDQIQRHPWCALTSPTTQFTRVPSHQPHQAAVVVVMPAALCSGTDCCHWLTLVFRRQGLCLAC